jgi:hypothetical protein
MNETTNAYINLTTIPWNDETRDKLIKLGSSFKFDIGDPANIKRVHVEIIAMFPQAQRKPDMYAIYVALASDLTKIQKWEEILEQFTMCGVSAIRGDEGDNERLTCICTQNDLGYTVSMKNLITGVVLNVGSSCMFKTCITEDQKVQGKEIEKQLNKIKRDRAAERKRIKELEENFRCCNKCNEYVIPRRGFQNTTCFDCRSKEGKRKCPCCGYYRIKEDTSYKRCFECNKLKK